MEDRYILSVIFNEDVAPVDKQLEKALTYVGPVAYHLGWNINHTVEALNYFVLAEVPLKKAATSLRHILLKLDSLGDEFNPMIHTFPEILPKLSEINKHDIEKIFGKSGDELWAVLTKSKHAK